MDIGDGNVYVDESFSEFWNWEESKKILAAKSIKLRYTQLRDR